jgi:hypothetical protein
MGNIPGLSVEAGGTDNLRVVTQGIGWEMFNSTDENMEVLITAEQVQLLAAGLRRRQPQGHQGRALRPAQPWLLQRPHHLWT